MKPSVKKPSVLTIESFPVPDPADLQIYTDWLSPCFEITNLYIDNLASTEVKEDCIVLTGSEWQLATDPVPEA